MTGFALLLWAVQEAAADPVVSIWRRLVGGEDPGAFLRAILLVFVGIPLLMGVSRWLRRWVGDRYSQQQGMVAQKVLLYPGVILILISALHQAGFNLTPLLGAAGILGIALGFASQTSVSNVISGFFLIAERPFEVDDFVQIGETMGRVLSIDTLSVKLRTFDNRFVRIPNETIIKSQVINITRFPIRRLDLNVGVAYKENVDRVRKVLLEVTDRNPRALMEPEPMVFFDGYGDSALLLQLRVWATRENFIALRNSLLEQVKARFDEEGIEIPFPHRTLYTGLATEPFPVRVVAEGSPLGASEPGPEAGSTPDSEAGSTPDSETGSTPDSETDPQGGSGPMPEPGREPPGPGNAR